MRTLVCDKVTALTAAQALSAALFARAQGKGGGAYPYRCSMPRSISIGPDCSGITLSRARRPMPILSSPTPWGFRTSDVRHRGGRGGFL